MAAIASVLPIRRAAAVVASVGVVFACVTAIWLDGRAEASVRGRLLRTVERLELGFVDLAVREPVRRNQFATQPYVGNGYFSQRIPAAGMGFLSSSNPIGWPLGTPRFTDALAAGLYANTNASLIYTCPPPLPQLVTNKSSR